ncbi:MAG: phage holin family protein [Sandaracinaceae bacterium]
MSILITWAVLTFSMWVATQLLSKMKIEGGLLSHLFVSAIFGILLTFVGSIVYVVLGTFSLGLLFVFSFLGKLLAGAIVLKLTDMFSSRLKVDGFGTAFLAALIMSFAGTVAEAVLRSMG